VAGSRIGAFLPPPPGARLRPQALGGRVAALGSKSLRLLDRLFGIHAPGAMFSVDSAAWKDHAFEIGIGDGQETSVVLCVERRRPESRGLVQTRHLNVYFRDREVPPALLASVQAHARRLDWTLDRFAELFEQDPELGKPGLPMPAGPDEAERPRSLLDTWGADDSYADFFAGGEVARSQLDSIDPSVLFQSIQHCEFECLNITPHALTATVSLVNYPWDERVREPMQPPAMAGAGDDLDADGMVTTDLVEDDVIFGNPDKLNAVLEYATSQIELGDKLLFFSNTCLPTVAGEDVESAVKRWETKSGKRILYLTVTPRSMNNLFQGLFVDRRLEVERAAPPPDRSAVNLIGFGGRRAVPELVELLGQAGVRVNVALLPDVKQALVDALPGAALSVLLPNDTWQHIYDQLVFGSRTPHVSPQAPYGFEGTRRWLSSVVEALGRPDEVEPAWQQHSAPWAERWNQLRKRAAEHRLGFVVRDEESFFLTTPGRSWGVPLLQVVEEMGFGIDVLVRVSEPDLARRTAGLIGKLLGDRAKHSIRAFDSFEFLRERLRQSPARAFLSYHFFDWRLSEAGKASFSIQHFELGAPGAVRTLERLLGVCETPFFDRYRAYLARTPEGLRGRGTP
jgi:hypothetical protein